MRSYFADGTSEVGDVLIGADGGRSKVREQRLPQLKRLDLGILAIAGRYILDEARMKRLLTALRDGSLNNFVPRGNGWMFVSSWCSRPRENVTSAQQAMEHYVVWAYVLPRHSLSLLQS